MSATLLQRVAAGDFAAMQACISEYSALVWSLARRYCAASEAEDAVQEVFIALWESAATFDPERGSEVTFVAMIARRRFIDRSRKDARRHAAHDRARDAAEPKAAVEPDAPAALAEETDVVLDAISSLGETQRWVLGLAIHRGLTHDQIAAITQLPLGTVKTHVRRGMIKVRDHLAAERQPAADGGIDGRDGA